MKTIDDIIKRPERLYKGDIIIMPQTKKKMDRNTFVRQLFNTSIQGIIVQVLTPTGKIVKKELYTQTFCKMVKTQEGIKCCTGTAVDQFKQHLDISKALQSLLKKRIIVSDEYFYKRTALNIKTHAKIEGETLLYRLDFI